ncbi:hypothetical protein HDU98_010795 [Podochytrium sp. JEL0797]|nr:hypothetical protein HDU98_010795 [Podochytrium sp. JEL0797]
MIPIYSICSCLSFRFFWYSIYFDIVRDCYEAFVIFSFFALLQQYLGANMTEQHAFMQTIHAPSRMRYPFPLNCFTFNPRGHAFLVNVKCCVLQYVVIRPVMTIAAYVMEGNVVWNSDNTADLIQSFLVSFEMVVAAFIHLKAFSHKEFVPLHNKNENNSLQQIPKTRVLAAMWDSLWMSDILRDIVDAPGEVKEINRMRKERRERRALESRSSSLDHLNDEVVATEMTMQSAGPSGVAQESGFVIGDGEDEQEGVTEWK